MSRKLDKLILDLEKDAREVDFLFDTIGKIFTVNKILFLIVATVGILVTIS
jgi:hypothetical protein